MMQLLLQLLGIRTAAGGAARIVHTSLELRGLNWLPIVLLIGAGLGWLVWWTYRRVSELPAARRWTLVALRGALLLLIVGILLRPAIAVTIEGAARRTLAILVDSSASMGIADRRTETADRGRQAIAKDLTDPETPVEHFDGAAGGFLSRQEIVKSVFANQHLDLLPQLSRDHDLRAYAFASAPTELPEDTRKPQFAWFEPLKADGAATALGDSIREILSRSRGQGLAGIFVATDGASNSGSSALAAAEMARSAGVPLYLYGVGVTSPRDIVVSSIFARDVCFIDDAVPVLVRVRGQGMSGQSATVRLKLGEKLVDERPVTFESGEEQAVAMSFTPGAKGEFKLSASIDARDDEAVRDNNSAAMNLRVVDAKIKVLVVEQSPRWEYRYLQTMLLRDRRVEAKFVLIEGDPAIATVAANSPYLTGFPSSKEELLKFDLLIFGDVDPSALTSAQLQSIADFVSRFGGGLLMIPGRRFGVAALAGTPLANLAPVEANSSDAKSPAGDEPIRFDLTLAGRESAMLRLSDKPQESQRIWASLPPMYWIAPVARAKPGAEILAETSTDKKPLVALQPYGLGQVLYVGTDNTWRWRKGNGERYHVALWGQLVQTLALPHMLGQSKRVQLSMDRSEYSSGQRVTIYARLYGPDYQPRTEATVEGVYQSTAHNGSPSEGKAPSEPSSVNGDRLGRSLALQRVQLRALPQQPGVYRGDFAAGDSGSYEFWIATDPETRLNFSVTPPRQEFQETALNESLLKQMAQTAGGAYVREEDLHDLPAKIQSESQRVRSSYDVEIWSSPLYFLAMLGLVSAEWIVRKASNLK